MTAAAWLTVILASGPDLPLCGRPAADWLLDTAAELGPVAVAASGCGADQVRDLAVARPELAAALAAAAPEPDDGQKAAITVVLSCRYPLLQAAVLRQALRTLSGQPEPGAVLIRARAAAPWWSAEAGPAGVAAVALSGLPGGCPDWLTRLEQADPCALRGRLADLGVSVTVTDADPVQSLRADDPVQRQRAEAALYERIAAGWQHRGVIIEDPSTTRIDATVRIGPGTRIRPQTELAGRTVIGAGSSIGPVTAITDSTAGDGCRITYAVCTDVTIGEGALIGPFCWLRSGSRLGARTRAGSFVEVADSVVGDDTQIPHLGGVLSADVGKGCNIAWLSGPANFNGREKNRVVIGDHAYIGAGNIMVAPLTVGDGAYTAAGSILTEDVPSGALAIGRARQVNVDGWVARKMPGSAPAEAAARHAATTGGSAGTRESRMSRSA